MNKKVLVIGGGYAGVEAAIELQKKKIFDVTLISDREFLYQYPISIWVPVDTIKYDNVKIDLGEIQKAHKFKLILDSVKQIITKENKIITEKDTIGYDYLVIALGAHKTKPNGVENTLSICGNPEDSLKIKEKLNQLIAKGSGKIAMGFSGNPKEKSAVRGGPAFELIFNVHKLLKKKKIRSNFELTFFAPVDKPGAKMGGNAFNMLDKVFSKMDINKRFGKKFKSFNKNFIEFEDGSKLESDLIMLIPAGTGHSVFKNSDLPLSEGGFVKINDDCSVIEINNVYAIGDSASLDAPDWVAKQAHTAEAMAKNTAYNIYNKEKGINKIKGYKEDLSVACLMDMGDSAALVFRNKRKEFMIPFPFIGHYIKYWMMYFNKRKKIK